MEGRRPNRRAFRPTLDTRLESRVVLSRLPHVPGAVYVANPRLGFAFAHNNPPFLDNLAPKFDFSFSRAPHQGVQTAHGGQTVRVWVNGGAFDISLTEFLATSSTTTTTVSTNQLVSTSSGGTTTTGGVQVAGTVRAYPMPGGKFGIIVDGTTDLSELDITPVPFPQRKGYAHSFAYGFAGRPRVLNVGSLDVTSGHIGAILGYHTADLSGPLTVDGPGPVDRIAFNSLQPGASIVTGGDVNTLDVLANANLSGGPGISIGRDLNFVNIGGDLSLENGTNFLVNRFLGLVPQPVKGTETGIITNTSTLTNQLQAGGIVQGNLAIFPNSTFTIVSGIAPGAVLDIRGTLIGGNRVNIPNADLAPPNPNVIVRNGIVPT
jgi:hypothetical protein